ncbi:prolow-density lipoprotein receptor-related protein 1-like isoform X5 [Mercenaria mercenaria]|uniref:prolow-density lipoprotein receptor-related protein 1-like isoform X5 n=1 Tax=Mercenaria mercenaria TaxID=6596 RepID=UPI001E1DA6B5|nr:prolow-density lipoprotein receptor-related protein 1-like isoform X5 [Mercenaria mercenaria]
MKSLILLVVLIGIYKTCSAKRCELTLQKDGNIIKDGEHVLGIGGDLNQIYCKALCSGPGPTPGIKWYREPSKRPVRMFSGRVYQVRTTFRRVGILTIRNMLYSDTATYRCKAWLRDQGWVEKSFELVYGCKDSEHLCDTSRCVSQAHICDGKAQCTDGTDEQNCKECKGNEFHCDDGDCIPSNRTCDGYYDCVDGSDEYNCGCLPDFTCSHGGCVSQEKVCDGNYDCSVGEDEVNCTFCEDDEFHCGNRVCIAAELHCDGWDDCPDGSDESRCPLKVKIDNPEQEVFERETVRFTCIATQSSNMGPYDLTWSRQDEELPDLAYIEEDTLVIPDVDKMDAGIYVCTGSDGSTVDKAAAELVVNERCPGNFECLDGSCISTESVCDLVQDCPGGEDEYDCEYCDADEVHCGDGNCITADQVCDGYNDCNNGTDEEGCCIDGFQCLDGTCLENDIMCDGFPDCSEGEDEENCSCLDGFQCLDGTCLENDIMCDGIPDCSEGEDEENCSPVCETYQFRCSGGNCINNTYLCDRVNDCPLGEDEVDCSPVCETYQYQCSGGNCINNTYLCDRVNDCLLGEDEVDCTCYTDSFRCDDSECVDKSAVCNGTLECMNGADEDNCDEPCNLDDEFTCASRNQCIPIQWHCDGTPDCRDASDECGCAAVEFICKGGMCIGNDSVCDGIPDCKGEDDELNCGDKACAESQFLCPDKSKCLTTTNVCDGKQDCDDNWDESEDNCGPTVTEPDMGIGTSTILKGR